MLSLSEPILLVIGLALFEILHTRNLHHPIPTAENELVVEGHKCISQKFLDTGTEGTTSSSTLELDSRM